MATAATRLNYQDLQQIPPDGNRYELIEGELFVAPPLNISARPFGFRGYWLGTQKSTIWVKFLLLLTTWFLMTQRCSNRIRCLSQGRGNRL
jgi:hypothetical protein